jgi:hypothetical protein
VAAVVPPKLPEPATSHDALHAVKHFVPHVGQSTDDQQLVLDILGSPGVGRVLQLPADMDQ